VCAFGPGLMVMMLMVAVAVAAVAVIFTVRASLDK
jgi:hypothetical protein